VTATSAASARPVPARVPLHCPRDGTPLREEGDAVECGLCGARFSSSRGVVRMVAEMDAFYEGAYLNHVRFVPRSERPWHALPLWIISNGFLWATRRHVPLGATVVELGCAGGVAYFGSRYRMIGVDLSGGSLERASAVYNRCLQADASKPLPLASGSVDAVISSYFWEHIPPPLKPAMLAECRRILRPGGKLVFLYDVKTENPLISALRGVDESRYQREFIEQDGHLGYETPDENARTFEEAGFQVLENRGYERGWLQSSSVYEKMAVWPGMFGFVGRIARLAGRAPFVVPYMAMLRVFDETVARFRPLARSRIVLTVAQCRNAQ
jgi:SAM-dependent methyltransferase